MTDFGQGYLYPSKKSRKVWWILGGSLLVLVLLGTCVRGAVYLSDVLSERQEASLELVETFLKDGLPDAGHPIYSRRANAAQVSIDSVNRYIRQFGPVQTIEQPSCSMNSSMNTKVQESGTFAKCLMAVSTELSPGTATIRWVREDDEWKLFYFNITYTDQSVLLEKAERMDKLSGAGKEDGSN